MGSGLLTQLSDHILEKICGTHTNHIPRLLLSKTFAALPERSTATSAALFATPTTKTRLFMKGSNLF